MGIANVKNKRGSFVFDLFLTMAVLTILVYASYKFSLTSNNTQTKEIGKIQIDLINMYNNGERAIFFIEQSAKYAQTDALVKIYENGGYSKSECGNSEGINLWYKAQKNCFLNKELLQSEFSKIYTEKLNEYSLMYSEIKLENKYDVKSEGIYFLINGNEIMLSNDNIKYFAKPEIKIESADDLSFILKNSDLVKSNIKICKSDIKCWQDLDSSFMITQKGKILLFEIDSTKKVGMFEERDLILKFGIDFSENNPLFV